MSRVCDNCGNPQGKFIKWEGHKLCPDVVACNKRRAKIDKDRWGDEQITFPNS